VLVEHIGNFLNFCLFLYLYLLCFKMQCLLFSLFSSCFAVNGWYRWHLGYYEFLRNHTVISSVAPVQSFAKFRVDGRTFYPSVDWSVQLIRI